MAVEAQAVPPAVLRIEAALLDLLRASAVQGASSTVLLPLPSHALEEHVTSFTNTLASGDAQVPSFLETAARRCFYAIVNSNEDNKEDSGRLWTFLDILLQISETRQTGRAIVWYLIEELVERQTANRCRVIFDYLDARRERLTQREFQVTHLIILRTCNELLRRLSRAEDATFCGRVFFFLFQIFPLGEQSSVNLRGEFHTDNVTLFDDPALKDTAAADDPMSIDQQTEAAVDEAKRSPSSANKTGVEEIDRFYGTFWRLQQDFSMPTRLTESEDDFSTFKNGLEETMKRFGATPVVQTKSSTEGAQGTKRKRDQEDSVEQQGDYNPKYLTSRELFGLELSDLSFQRHILVQALILIDFLLSLSEQAQKSIDKSGISRLNTSVNYTYKLSEEKREWAQSARARITTYLQQGPDGNFYYRMVNTVLARDKNWIWWKLQRCPPIVAEATPVEAYTKAREDCVRATTSRRMRARPIGALDLTFLAEADGTKGLDGLRDPARFTRPSVAQLVTQMQKEELDLDWADEADKEAIAVRMDSLGWRAVRAASRTALAKLDKIEWGRNVVHVLGPDKVDEDGAGLGDGAVAGANSAAAAAGKTPEVQVA